MTAPDVSVIVGFWNPGAEAIVATLRQLGALAGARHEVILVDDGSTDGTGDLVSQQAAKQPNWVLLRNPQNRGIAASRNRALAQARGRFVWFIDSDDEWRPEALTTMLRAATAHGADLAICQAEWRDPTGRRRGLVESVPAPTVVDGEAAFTWLLEGKLQGYLWTKLIRRDLIPPHPFPSLKALSDFAGLAPMVLGARRVATVSDVLYYYHLRAGSLVHSDPEVIIKGYDYRYRVVAALFDEHCARQLRPAQAMAQFKYQSWLWHKFWESARMPAQRRRSVVRSVQAQIRPLELRALLPARWRLAAKVLLVYLFGVPWATWLAWRRNGGDR